MKAAFRFLFIMTAAAFCSAAFAAHPVVPDHLPDDVKAQLYQKLAPDWQVEVKKYDALDQYEIRNLYADSRPDKFFSFLSDDYLQYRILRFLQQTPGAEDFVLQHLMDNSLEPRSRMYIYLRIGEDEQGNWSRNPRVIPALENAIVSEPSAEDAQAAFDALRMIEAHRFKGAIERRLDCSVFASGDGNGSAQAAERQEWLGEESRMNRIIDGIELPDFLASPPPVFDVKVSGPSIRAVIIGDYGTMDEEHENQVKVAAAMLAYSKKKPFDFGLTVGDNFYFRMKSPNDPLWKADFDNLYGPLGITFYPTFGNHDWDDPMAAIELLRSGINTDWQFPAPYYTFTSGPVQFFAINTGEDETLSLNEGQLDWLKTELDKSKARWKVVYGHYPVKDNELGVSWKVYERLMPILEGRADLYIAGHLHNFEYLKPEGSVNLMVVTSAGQAGPGGHDFDSDALYVKDNVNGFAVLEANDHDLTVRFIDSDAKQIYEASFHK